MALQLAMRHPKVVRRLIICSGYYARSGISSQFWKGFAAPSLVMVGDHDVMSVEHSAQLSRLLPHGELAVMPGAFHGTNLGAAEGARPGSPLVGLASTMIESFLPGQLEVFRSRPSAIQPESM